MNKKILITLFAIAAVIIIAYFVFSQIMLFKRSDELTNKFMSDTMHQYILEDNIKELQRCLKSRNGKKYLHSTSPEGQTGLHIAVQENKMLIVELLINHGANVNAKANRDATPLHSAARRDIATLLIEKGADVNAKSSNNITPLIGAARSANKEMALLLIEKGADLNAQDNKGMTPLHHSASCGYTEVALLLIESGADVNILDSDSRSPLHLAVIYNNIEIAMALLDAGADVKGRDYGVTLLHYAAHFGHKKLCTSLIQKGVEINIIRYTKFDKKGNPKKPMTPLDCAEAENQSETADLLRARGAKTGEELREEAKDKK
jgi:ankyrin repeat protein